MNSLSIWALNKRCLVFLNGFCIALFFGMELSHQHVQLKSIGIQRFEPVDYLDRGIFVHASQLIKSVCVIRVFCNGSIKLDRKSTRLNSSHGSISYAVFCLKKKIT